MFPNPSLSLPAMSALGLMGDRGTPRYRWTSATPIAGIGCPKTCKWGCGLTIHIFLLPSTSIRKTGWLSIQPCSDFQATEPKLSSKVVDQVLEAARCPCNQRKIICERSSIHSHLPNHYTKLRIKDDPSRWLHWKGGQREDRPVSPPPPPAPRHFDRLAAVRANRKACPGVSVEFHPDSPALEMALPSSQKRADDSRDWHCQRPS